MKRLLLFLILLSCSFAGFAKHLKGGFFTYKYLGQTATEIRYKVTLTVYMECGATGGQIDAEIPFTFYEKGKNIAERNVLVSISNQFTLDKTEDDECITGDQRGCYYKIVIYELASITLPLSSVGYTVSYQRCCRIDGINNLTNSGNIGNTYSVDIPGTMTAANAERNSSASFLTNDVIVVCGNSPLNYPFTATDPDGDILKYEFCDAWRGGAPSPESQIAPQQASVPPYTIVPYSSGYSGGSPLGSKVSIDQNTGLITGIAPALPGEYVVTVCVSEYRGNTLIATTRKELHMRVGNCTPIAATLDPSYITCDGYTLTFQNNSTSPEIKNHSWDFGVPNTTADVSNLAVPTFTYPDTGVYVITLEVNKGLACTDKTTAQVKVFPGFFPDFSFAGICVTKPSNFTDRTTATYGVVDSWAWDFGNPAVTTDNSTLQNPAYSYPATGNFNVRLIATSSKGCKDTVVKPINIIDKPPISVRFKDTLICNGDALQLEAIGNGSFSWTPSGADITNANTATPTVNPSATKKYFVELNNNGCLNTDSVRVRVVDFVTLQARGDTIICATDSVRLNATSDGLKFLWTPSATIGNPNIINPMARPPGTITYTVTASIGHCTATDDVIVRTVPYPGVNAGADTTICFATTAQLNGSMVGSSFSWSPLPTLSRTNTLSPLASPVGTTAYVLTVFDNIGCPKPSRDTVLVTVLPKIAPFAGRDTAVVVGQPLQFNATGGVRYAWSPSTWLNRPDIANPVAVYNNEIENIRYKVQVFNQANCVDSAFVSVRIFKTNPQVFVPTAFTPDGDGKNDIFRPIAVGITRIEYFRVFNRWGEQVFNTTINGKGWDGRIRGKDQGSGTFVWLVKGVDYTGKSFFAKGTVTLIR
jgi:gliding motility-associated-like protein